MRRQRGRPGWAAGRRRARYSAEVAGKVAGSARQAADKEEYVVLEYQQALRSPTRGAFLSKYIYE